MARHRSRSQGSRASLRRKPPPIAFCPASQPLSSSPIWGEPGNRISMLFLTRCFGVTGSDSERNLGAEQACTEEIVQQVLRLQAKSAALGHCPLARGTHAKGVTARARFEVFDLNLGR